MALEYLNLPKPGFFVGSYYQQGLVFRITCGPKDLLFLRNYLSLYIKKYTYIYIYIYIYGGCPKTAVCKFLQS